MLQASLVEPDPIIKELVEDTSKFASQIIHWEMYSPTFIYWCRNMAVKMIKWLYG
jgi:hypothetical protein